VLSPQDFFDLEGFEHKALFEGVEYVWEVLPRIEEYVRAHLRPEVLGEVGPGAYVDSGQVFVGEGTVIEPGACVKGPAIIGKHCEIRAGAYVRENALIGDQCVLGNSSEIKNSVMLNLAAAPHYNYLGDSLIGAEVNLGAGTKVSNLKLTWKNVTVKVGDKIYDTGLLKFGAIIGDRVQTGCNAVLNPGTIVGPDSLIYACASVRGYLPPRTIVKLRQQIEFVPKEER